MVATIVGRDTRVEQNGRGGRTGRAARTRAHFHRRPGVIQQRAAEARPRWEGFLNSAANTCLPSRRAAARRRCSATLRSRAAPGSRVRPPLSRSGGRLRVVAAAADAGRCSTYNQPSKRSGPRSDQEQRRDRTLDPRNGGEVVTWSARCAQREERPRNGARLREDCSGSPDQLTTTTPSASCARRLALGVTGGFSASRASPKNP